MRVLEKYYRSNRKRLVWSRENHMGHVIKKEIGNKHIKLAVCIKKIMKKTTMKHKAITTESTGKIKNENLLSLDNILKELIRRK